MSKEVPLKSQKIIRRSDMAFNNDYDTKERTRSEIEALNTPTVLEFGTAWCGYCQTAQPFIVEAFVDYPQISHIKIEDGRGRPLGRSFGVKLWPTLVFLKNGKEVRRLVRPQSAAEIGAAMRKICVGMEESA
jgi:thioredoxin 1